MLMDPNTPPTPPPYVPQSKRPVNQYQFINDLGEPPKKSKIPGGSSKKVRIAVVLIGVLLFAIIASIFISFLGSSGKADVEALESAAKQQHELIRIADIGVKKSRGQAARNIAVTTKLSLKSQQTEMLSAVKLHKKKFGNKELKAAEDPKNDQLLTAAEQSNRFDEEFISWIEKSLTDYQKTVERAYEGAKTTKLKEALLQQYQSANTLAGVAGGRPE
ncbi:hypothetical protein BH23PAT1_BH23PAT1_1300 [soil metagenome]